MTLELVTEAPRQDDFTPLSEHQAETPATFFGARPVLHHYSPGAKLAVRKSEYEQNEVLRQVETDVAAGDEDVLLQVDIWVTSKSVILFSPTSNKGVSINYHAIALHALGSQDGQTAVYLQLDLHDKELTNDDEDIQTLTLHLIPKDTVLPQVATATNGHNTDGEAENGSAGTNSAAAKELFEALSACADLNPDPMDEDDDEGEGLQMPEPGAGGWITSENMHEFMDENGNWTGPEIPVLGAGAGQVRTRDDADDGEADGVGEDDETKWRRTG